MINNKIYNFIYYIIVTLICIIMFSFISQKEGFHEDEMFSYGSSNYRYDNLFQAYGDKDYINVTIENEILNTKTPIKNIMYYIFNSQEFIEKINETQSKEKPIWKTKEDALKYTTIQKDDILNLFSVYYNQSRDAHPPLFYYLVHIVSSIFTGIFSKYIIFIINLILFMLCSFIIKKIFVLIDKRRLAIPTLILYGLSIGGISTVMFQRMYMLLTFFILYYTYINIYIIKQNFIIEKDIKLKLGIITILGFLTQYYFCIYALFMFGIIEILIYKKSGKELCLKMLKYYIKLSFIGIIIFPASIYHIFFSYRGVSAISNNFGIVEFFKLINTAYSSNFLFIFIIEVIFVIISFIIVRKSKDSIINILLFTIIGYILIVSKISPYLELRYIMGILPIIAIVFWLMFDYISKQSNILLILSTLIVLICSVNILITKKPLYLYSGYTNNIKIAEANHNLKFIYISDNGFNHIQSMPEFIIYEESLILNTSKEELKYLAEDEKLKNETEFIVSIKEYMNTEDIRDQILQLTDCNNYEILLDFNTPTGNVLYKFCR